MFEVEVDRFFWNVAVMSDQNYQIYQQELQTEWDRSRTPPHILNILL